MRGIYRNHGAAQTAAARQDWRWLVDRAYEYDISQAAITAAAGWPPEDAGWKTIDKHIARLREYILKQYPGENLTLPSARTAKAKGGE